MVVSYPISLEVKEPNNDIGILRIRQSDEESQTLIVQILEYGLKKSYEGLEVFFCAKLGQTSGLGIIEQKLLPSEMTDPKNGKFEYTMRVEDWQQLGRQTAYFSFRKMKDDHTYVQQFSTRDFTYEVTKNIYSDGIKEVTKDGSTYVWTFEDLLRLLQEFKDSGETDFLAWFDEIKDQLSEDAAGNLMILYQSLRDKTGKDSDFREFESNLSYMERVYNENAERGVNAKWFGAKGDGVSDDTVAIQNAIDSLNNGGTIYFPKGEYLIEKTIYLKSNIRLMGDSANTILKKETAGNAFDATNLHNISVESLNVENTNNGGIFFKFKGTNNIYISNINIKGIGNVAYTEGISIREGDNATIVNSYFKGTTGHCVAVGTNTLSPVGKCENITVDNCIFEDFGTIDGGMGIDVSGGVYPDGSFEEVKNVRISNSTFKNGNSNGLKIQIVKDLIFTSNVVEGNADIGVVLNAQNTLLKNIVVSDNIFSANGVHINLMSHGTTVPENIIISIKNNTFTDSVGSNIYFSNISNGLYQISGNKFISTKIAIDLARQAGAIGGDFIIEQNEAECLSFVARFSKKMIIKNNKIKATYIGIYDLDSDNADTIDSILITGNELITCDVRISRPKIKRLQFQNNTLTGLTSAYGLYVDGTNGVVNVDVLIVNDNLILNSNTAAIRLRNTKSIVGQCARNTVDKIINIDEVNIDNSNNLVVQ